VDISTHGQEIEISGRGVSTVC